MSHTRATAWPPAWLGVVLCVGMTMISRAFGQVSEPQRGADPRSLGFAYDPQEEEGPHPESDFEWWYHFGFLKRKGSPKPEYSFVSSFQRNKAGRYLFYNLSDLSSGKNRHHAVVDRSVLGVLPFLPQGHEFLTPPNASSDPPKSELWLHYGENRLLKEKSSYRAIYKNREFLLDLTLHRQGPPMPVLGTGLTGLNKPEDQHYYTYPRMSAVGRLRIDKAEMEVEGEFWYDHQWGKVAAKTPRKWCWWGLRLSDGRNLSLFFLQDADTGRTVQKGLTLQHPDGKIQVCRDVVFTPKRSWKSPRARTYSVQWEIEARELGITIEIRAHADDHELPVLLYGRIWEGPCLAEVRTGGGRAVKGSGFQEMIGQGHD